MLLDTSIADWPAVAVSGNAVYVANDYVTSSTPYNTEIFFLRSMDNGATWSPHQQITFSVGRSEDEDIIAQGSEIYMSWNDNRNGQMQIFYKHSSDFGQSWDPDYALALPYGYGTMVWVDGSNIDIPFAGAPSGHYQTHLVHSPDNGISWQQDMDLTMDMTHTYYYPDLVRDGDDIHVTFIKSGEGAQYLHSTDGGQTWDAPYHFGNSNITAFIAYSGCMLHVILPDSGHISYFRNPTGNEGAHCTNPTGVLPGTLTGKATMIVYPNPISMQSTLELYSTGNEENVTIKIFDLLGVLKLSSPFKNNRLSISHVDFNSGIYFYLLLQADKIIGSGKLIVD